MLKRKRNGIKQTGVLFLYKQNNFYKKLHLFVGQMNVFGRRFTAELNKP